MDQERVWVEQAIAGNHAAFANLVAAYQGPVFNLAYRMLGNGGDAEDAAQETFLRAYDRLASYEPDRKFSSWILSIASHYCIDQLRRRRGGMESLDDEEGERDLPATEAEPEEVALATEQERTLQHALRQLPPAYRLAVILRYWNDLSYEEIADATGSSVSAIKSRLHRARLMLADSIGETDTAEQPAQRPSARPNTQAVGFAQKGPTIHAVRAN
ncbi:MAG: sigma-70 family RNA polymerase sigma factor [Anaerolineae bacterium]